MLQAHFYQQARTAFADCTQHIPRRSVVAMGHRDRQLPWFEGILARSGDSLNKVANKTGRNRSTFSRFLSGHTETMQQETIELLCQVYGVNPPDASVAGFAESDARPLEASEGGHDPLPHGSELNDWVITTDALRHLGIIPGDVLRVNPLLLPRPGDLVCAQIINFQLATADTVFRFYEPPFLISGSHERGHRRPRMIDESVTIMGVVERQLRNRAWRHAS